MSNIGSTSLRAKKRNSNPMQSFDSLPAPLRSWLHEAVLPWSPKSARRIWDRAVSKGKGTHGALMALQHAEMRTLARDKERLVL